MAKQFPVNNSQSPKVCDCVLSIADLVCCARLNAGTTTEKAGILRVALAVTNVALVTTRPIV